MKIPPNLRWKADGHTLGQGGQATVVSVVDTTDTLTGRYAMKALAPGKPAKAYERFAREVEAMKAIDHPHIARIVGHSAPRDEFQFCVIEYVEGSRPLKKLIGTGDNPFFRDALRALGFFQQLVSAIGAWEVAGVVHRDLSPANVLILPDGSISH
jgi:serine/threonine protein kinase